MLRSSFLALCVGAGVLLSSVAASAATDLPAPTQTGTLAGAATGAPAALTGIRTGRHDAYDRTVFDFTGGTPGYRIEYGRLVEQGRGDVIPLTGAADLVVVFNGLPEVRDQATRNPALPTLLQIKSGGFFEGYASYGLGLADRVGFRVLTLHNPERIAVDVAHQPTQPFGTGTVGYNGIAPDAVVTSVRSGSHPGYDRLVFDMLGPDLPTVSMSYVGTSPTIRVTFTGSGSPTRSPHASYTGAASYTFNLPTLRTLQFTIIGAGLMTADVTTTHHSAFRMMLLTNPTRVALDIRT